MKVLLKDYLVKDGMCVCVCVFIVIDPPLIHSNMIGASLEFATSVFRTILSEQGIDQLGKMLVNADMDSKLIELFPPNKREEDCLVRHFEAQDMKELVEFHQKNVMDSIKKDLLAKLHAMMTDEDANAKEV